MVKEDADPADGLTKVDGKGTHRRFMDAGHDLKLVEQCIVRYESQSTGSEERNGSVKGMIDQAIKSI